MSKIEWTETTWNPVTGCTKISAGCQHCYAERMAKRLQAMGKPSYRNGFQVTCHEDRLDEPSHWRKPRLVFVCSMGDLFHEEVPHEFIGHVFDAMCANPQHTFQILTKRPMRMHTSRFGAHWPHNVWAGVSVENQETADRRIPDLLKCPAAVRFVSMEPLLGPISCGNLRLLQATGAGIHWVIVGGESGPGARPMQEEWVVDIKDQCEAASVPFFFKQWGRANKKKNGRLLQGRTWDAMPVIAEA